MMFDLNIELLKYKERLQIREIDGERAVLDIVRKKWVQFTSEEFVRQLLIHYLIIDRNFPKSWISVEKGIQIDGVFRRYDLAVYNQEMEPYILIECKSPTIKLTQDAFDQVQHYNMGLHVPYMVISNGIQSYCCTIEKTKKALLFIREIPKYRRSKIR